MSRMNRRDLRRILRGSMFVDDTFTASSDLSTTASCFKKDSTEKRRESR